MMQLQRYGWPLLGFGAVAFSAWLLYGELKGLSLDELWESIVAIAPGSWLLCLLATLAAYAALAGYDRLALLHLGRRGIGWAYVLATSFTTYALAHNIGASVFSGSVVRYRAYSAKGLSATEVGVLVAFCTFTFLLGVLLLSGLVLIVEPGVAERFLDMLPIEASAATGLLLLGLVLFYLLGSVLRLKPLRTGSFELAYPRFPVVAQQLTLGPLEIMSAALIVYFALPEAGNPGFIVVLGIFLVAFSLALLSHAPGGLGVLEIAFITGLPEMDPVDVLAALLVFRLLYLLIPFAIALLVVLSFERRQLVKQIEVQKDADVPTAMAAGHPPVRSRHPRTPAPASATSRHSGRRG